MSFTVHRIFIFILLWESAYLDRLVFLNLHADRERKKVGCVEDLGR